MATESPICSEREEREMERATESQRERKGRERDMRGMARQQF